MTKMEKLNKTFRGLLRAGLFAFLFVFAVAASAQETTGSVQGTVTDPTGASVVHAHVTITGTTLIGKKELDTDHSGFYRFVNLLPGTYDILVGAEGFAEKKMDHITIVVGANPTINVPLTIGASSTVVEVNTATPVIDITESRTQTIIDKETLMYEPHGASFQSVISVAPGANIEPLQGGGVSINGAATSENSYLLEGVNTQGLITGTSQANAPAEFIDEVQVKTAGYEAQYGGALGGVVEALQVKGSNRWHGQAWVYYLGSGLDASPSASLRYDPLTATPTTRTDVPVQYYNPLKDHYRTIRPGVLANGYIVKDRIWTTLGFQPNAYSLRRTATFNTSNCKGTLACTGPYIFEQDAQTYYGLARVDAKISERFRAFGAWTYQYYRISGSSLPNADNRDGVDLTGASGNHLYYNTTSTSNPLNYNHGIGNVQPNLIVSAGLDETFTHNIVGTTRYGYFYENYQDRGLPTGVRYYYQASALSGLALDGTTTSTTPSGGNQAAGFDTLGSNTAYLAQLQSVQSFAQDVQFFKKTSFGLHNIAVGYALNHAHHNENLQYNTGLVYLYPFSSYAPISSYLPNCYTIEQQDIAAYGKSNYSKGLPTTGTTDSSCRGNYGYAVVREYGTVGQASDNNHGIYFQDKWTFLKRFTANVGLRIEKEYLPSYDQYPTGISFGWGDKISPRLGGAWDVLGNGKLKVSGMYGVFYDVMKLNLAIDSFGGAYWHNCTYAWDTLDYTTINPVRGADGHYCSGTSNANFAGGTVPSNLRFIENQNYRIPANDPTAGAAVDPNLKPYRDHQANFGVAYQLTNHWAIEANYVRTRLDHAIEDAGLLGPNGEYFLIVNPGEGVDYQPVAGCSTCHPQPRAARSYDGVDFRISKQYSNHFTLRADYNYSRLRGNYSGLTNSDISDGGGGRNSANDNRSFDEPYFQFTAAGNSFNGLLPTDRPNRFKMDGLYRTTLMKKLETGIGLFQQIYQGTPLSSYMDVQNTAGSYPVYIEGRGKWVPVSVDGTGNLTFGAPIVKRTPAFIQTDVNFTEQFHIGGPAHEGMALRFEWYASNLFNQKAATVIQSHINSSQGRTGNYLKPFSSTNYGLLENGYDYKNEANLPQYNGTSTTGMVAAATYGQASSFQSGRTMRMMVKLIF